MERLIINGDPGIRKGAVIEVEGGRRRCFSISRNGEFHGPDQVQLWCVVGDDDEAGTFERREFIPHALEVTALNADEVTVIEPTGELSA